MVLGTSHKLGSRGNIFSELLCIFRFILIELFKGQPPEETPCIVHIFASVIHLLRAKLKHTHHVFTFITVLYKINNFKPLVKEK